MFPNGTCWKNHFPSIEYLNWRFLKWSPTCGYDCFEKSNAKYHYRIPALCRVPRSLPWANPRAHGKECVCRGSNSCHTVNVWRSVTNNFAVCAPEDTRQTSALPWAAIGKEHADGKRGNGRCPASPPLVFVVCPIRSSRQRLNLPCAPYAAYGKSYLCRVPGFWHTAKWFFFFHLLSFKFFLLSKNNIWYSMLKFYNFLYMFAIFK
jgi:hypothetical protein